ncbi:ras-related protein Rab-26 isoform 2-T2 [Hipposideros larvatus]
MLSGARYVLPLITSCQLSPKPCLPSPSGVLELPGPACLGREEGPQQARKKTPKSKGASAPAASALPASSGPRPARPGTARAGLQAPLNGLPQPARPSLGGGSDFYDVAFKVMLVGDSGVGKTCLLVRFKDGAFLAGTFISTVGIDFRNKVLDVDGMKVKLQIWDTAGQERFRSVTHAYYRDAHALLLLYDVTNKASFDNIQVSGFLPGEVDRPRPHPSQPPSGSCSIRAPEGSEDPTDSKEGKGPSGLLVAWVTFQLHQPNTLDEVPVRSTSAWHMGSSFWTPPVSQSPTGTVQCCLEGPMVPPVWSQISQQAWLTEIQEYAQHNVVLMLLGNKVDSAQERVVKREDGEKLAKEYGLPFMETSAKTGLNVDLAFTAIAKSEILGAVFARAQRRSSSTTSLLLYLDLITNKLENPVSQRYVVGNGRRRRNTVSDRTGYDCKHLIQNFVTGIVEKSVLAASLLISSMNSSCAVSETSSTLTVNGLLASANGVSGKFGKYNEISSASLRKCSFTEIIIVILLSGSMSCSSKKADRVGNM